MESGESDFKHAAVVGCGLIGAGWAAQMLMHGLIVTACDLVMEPDALLASVRARLIEAGTPEKEADTLMERFHCQRDLETAVANVQWVQESIIEDVDRKREVISRIDAATAPDVIIATSTSSLKIVDMQVGSKHPERFLAGHPFLPVTLIPLVEVMGGPDTSAETIEKAMAFYARIGKAPIHVLKEIAGLVGNRLQAAVQREAFYMLSEGVASAADIDKALSEGLGPRWAATGAIISFALAGGDKGIRGAFSQFAPVLRTFWKELGDPKVTPELEQEIIAACDAMLEDTPAEEWMDRRWKVVRAAQKAKLN
ncbi:MAG: 3-hydroxyacyl-CoA dehydrogenase [Nitratireductor sp.]|nr:3-hydroxyacyl-CoA dehydrogenase [Nitratireductor sp.]